MLILKIVGLIILLILSGYGIIFMHFLLTAKILSKR